MTPARAAHLVGSIPAADTAAAMELAVQTVGDALRWLPDGETGERRTCPARPIVESMRDHPDLELDREGDWSDHDHTPRFRVRRGRKLRAAALHLGYVDAFRAGVPEFRAVKAKLGLAGLRFQVGIPGDRDLAHLILGPVGAVLNGRPFRDATVAELRTIFDEGGDEVTFQIEIPLEFALAVRSPALLRPLVARMLARRVAATAGRAPEGARFGVHLSLGDLDHEARVGMKDVTPAVAIANAVAAAWPDGRMLEYVHAPFEGATHAPPLDPGYYEPLRRLALPDGTRFIAGFADEQQPLEDQLEVRRLIEEAVGGPVDVSAACGLGRRSLDEAVRSMQRLRGARDRLTAALPLRRAPLWYFDTDW